MAQHRFDTESRLVARHDTVRADNDIGNVPLLWQGAPAFEIVPRGIHLRSQDVPLPPRRHTHIRFSTSACQSLCPEILQDGEKSGGAKRPRITLWTASEVNVRRVAQEWIDVWTSRQDFPAGFRSAAALADKLNQESENTDPSAILRDDPLKSDRRMCRNRLEFVRCSMCDVWINDPGAPTPDYEVPLYKPCQGR